MAIKINFKIIAFSTEKYHTKKLNNMTNGELLDMAMSDVDNTFIYNYASICEFTNDLNDGAIDIDNKLLYSICYIQ